ncbi:hypothetical protein [Enterococcus innesii]|nr:hypothetical protein [Enterococcus innesii]MDC0752347.1 hypothetical protein [Enterococcus innesii]MDC0776436.1 hypothetical protein [Enterococcus innesii]MDC0780697.1 hypothetical protein [Enterococcus innesii]MDC0783204.1 hypothetical protein [Enterococcus innesii]
MNTLLSHAREELKQPNNDNETILSSFISVLSINLMFMLFGWIVMMFI